MSTRERAFNLLEQLTDEQLEEFISMFTPKGQNWENIEEIEPDEWDRELIADSKTDNDEIISYDNLVKKLGVAPDDLRD